MGFAGTNTGSTNETSTQVIGAAPAFRVEFIFSWLILLSSHAQGDARGVSGETGETEYFMCSKGSRGLPTSAHCSCPLSIKNQAQQRQNDGLWICPRYAATVVVPILYCTASLCCITGVS